MASETTHIVFIYVYKVMCAWCMHNSWISPCFRMNDRGPEKNIILYKITIYIYTYVCITCETEGLDKDE